VNTRRAAAAACAFLVIAGCTGNQGREAGGQQKPSTVTSSTPASTPTPSDPVLSPLPGEVIELDQHGPEYVFTKAGRYAVRLGPRLVYEVDSPDMWEVYRGTYFSTSDFSGGTGVFSFDGPIPDAWLPTHPCGDRTLVPVGPKTQDLTDALAAQPALDVTRPTPVSIAGGHGVRVEVSIRERVNPSACEEGKVVLFTATGHEDDWWELRGGETITYWILDVHGQRFIAAAWCETTCSDTDHAVLEGMAESVTLERRS